MRKVVYLLFILLFFSTSNAAEVLDMKCATDIKNKEPVGVSSTFDNYVGKVYCWTRIVTDEDLPTYVYHVWYYDDKEMAKVKLDIWSSNFRTWSSKIILPSWIGKWRVVVEDKDGNVLAESQFEIVPKSELNQ